MKTKELSWKESYTEFFTFNFKSIGRKVHIPFMEISLGLYIIVSILEMFLHG